jgi:hypothetical protein
LGRKQIITEEIQWEKIQNKPEIVTKNIFDTLQASLDQALEKIQSLEQRVTALEKKP